MQVLPAVESGATVEGQGARKRSIVIVVPTEIGMCCREGVTQKLHSPCVKN